MCDVDSEAILSSLVRDPSRADNMVAEVRSQSADDLVDGVTAAQEAKYNYQHYFGNRYNSAAMYSSLKQVLIQLLFYFMGQTYIILFKVLFNMTSS